MWNHTIVRELAVVLVLKLAALCVLWLAFFNQGGKPELTHREVGRFLLGESRDAVGTPGQFTQDKGAPDDY